MDDSVSSPSWTIDAQTRAAVLLEEARKALLSGDPELAVAWAEEVLDEEPDDVDALRIVADAAPRYGHAEVGVLAARQMRARGAEPGILLAAALFAACDPEGAEDEARSVLAAHPRDARAYAVFGQCRELRGAPEEAAVALSRARSLDPSRYPAPLVLPPEDWARMLEDARAALSPENRAALEETRIVLSAVPRMEELRAVTPPASPATTALYLDTTEHPRTMFIYQRNLCRGAKNRREALDELLTALEHELLAVQQVD